MPEDLYNLSVEEVAELIAAERARQIDKGYTPEHDDEHGVPHLITWAQNYVHNGEPIKAMALMAAAMECYERKMAGVA